jgi:aspartate kinase
MIVMKFGGTSLKDAEMFKKSAEIVLAEPREKIVVVSACAGMTDALKGMINHASRNTSYKMVSIQLKQITSFHRALLDELFPRNSKEHQFLSSKFKDIFLRLSKVSESVGVLKECSPKTLDYVMAFGEALSSAVFAALLDYLAKDDKYSWALPHTYIRTNNNFGNAEIDLDATKKELLACRIIKKVKTLVIAGFIGTTKDFTTTTLGRNGSDYTAAAIANIFDAEELQIWKEVDGVMRADPKIIPEARVLDKISYEEAMEMTYFGSKVLHPRSILPALQKGIPIRIKNSYNPNSPGTLISPKSDDTQSGVKVISAISDLALINVVGKGMLGVAGIAARVFGATARAGANVMMISQASSEQSICLVIQEKDREKSVREIEKEFEPEIHRGQLEKVESESGISIISIVGDGMRGSIGTDAKFATALARAEINNKAIAQGSSERNISRAIESKDVKKAVRSVYNQFFGGQKCER